MQASSTDEDLRLRLLPEDRERLKIMLLAKHAKNDTGAPDPTIFPSQAPIEGNNPSYDLTITAADDTGFTIRATPIAGGRQAGDGFIQLDSLGRRSWDADNDGTIGGNENTWDR